MAARKTNLRSILGGATEPPDDGWGHVTPNIPHDGELWSEIVRDQKGRPLPTVANIGLIISRSDEWEVVYDEFADRAIVRNLPDCGAKKARRGELDEYHVAIASNWLATFGLDAGPKVTMDGLVFAGKQRWFDPLKEYFRGLIWDGVPRIERWLSTYLGVDDEFVWPLGRMWLISGVDRAINPGCQADYMLVLIGGQGKKKSGALEALCPNKEWFQPDLPDLRDKDSMQALTGAFIINADEMNALKRADLAELAKNYLTRKADRYRAPYKAVFKVHPRRCVFAGTSNNERVLNDPTGGRRFWCARVGKKIDLLALRRDRDQLWAEAMVLYTDGVLSYPDTELESAIVQRNRDGFTMVDEWRSRIEIYCVLNQEVSVGELLAELGFDSQSKWTQADQGRVISILTSMDWEQTGQRTREGKRERVWRKRAEEITHK